ncbi:hypothetical protein FRC10_010382 [Ceratobasidium sp. 414]|nr:hypothetical protein FRC10_010382 [Ceratobasidium sp. 414]
MHPNTIPIIAPFESPEFDSFELAMDAEPEGVKEGVAVEAEVGGLEGADTDMKIIMDVGDGVGVGVGLGLGALVQALVWSWA